MSKHFLIHFATLAIIHSHFPGDTILGGIGKVCRRSGSCTIHMDIPSSLEQKHSPGNFLVVMYNVQSL